MSTQTPTSFKRLAMLLSWFLRLSDDCDEAWSTIGMGWQQLDPEWADRFIDNKLPEILSQDEHQVKKFWDGNRGEPLLQIWEDEDQQTKRRLAVVLTVISVLFHVAESGGVPSDRLEDYTRQILTRLQILPTKTWLRVTMNNMIPQALEFPEKLLNKIWLESMRDGKFPDN